MDNKITDATATLLDVFKALGRSSGVVEATLLLLQKREKRTQRGNYYTRAVVYDVIHERSQNPDVVAAFIDAAEAETQRRRAVAARAAGVVATVNA